MRSCLLPLIFRLEGGETLAAYFVDLHLHLDGSLPLKTILSLADKQKIPLPTYDPIALCSYVSVPPNCSNLNEYLRCFKLPLQLLQTPEALFQAVYDLCEELTLQQVAYAEIRFAPQLHTRQSLTQTEAVEAVLAGLKKAQRNFPLQSQLILCCMRIPDPQTENFETLCVAEKFLGQGVCAVDLAGAEALFPTQNYAELFQEARKRGLPFTIHAGEAAGSASIQNALDFGAHRIGHGIRCMENASLMKQLKQRQIPLEICPKSNLDTKAIPGGISHYPLMNLLEQGLFITINTDNMTVSGTTLAQEFALLKKYFSLSPEQEKRLMKNAVQAAFLSESEKTALWKKIAASIPS